MFWIVLLGISCRNYKNRTDEKEPSLPEVFDNNAIPPVIRWHQAYGTEGIDLVQAGLEDSAGNYLALGQAVESSDQTEGKAILIKTTNAGELLWIATLGNPEDNNMGTSILETTEGYLLGGAFPTGNSQKVGLYALDQDGNRLWQNFYYHPNNGSILDMIFTTDGYIAATGYENTTSQNLFDPPIDGTGFLRLIDTDGTELWKQEFDFPYGSVVQQANNGDFFLLSSEVTEDEEHSLITRLDPEGEILWQHTVGPDDNHPNDMLLLPDDSLIITGQTTGFGAKNIDCFVLKLDQDGNTQWMNLYGQPRRYDEQYMEDTCYHLQQTSDDGLLVVGGTGENDLDYSQGNHLSGPSDEWKAYVFKLQKDGEMLWEQVYGDAPNSGDNIAKTALLSQGGNIVLFTDTSSQGTQATPNIGLMKLEAFQ